MTNAEIEADVFGDVLRIRMGVNRVEREIAALYKGLDEALDIRLRADIARIPALVQLCDATIARLSRSLAQREYYANKEDTIND